MKLSITAFLLFSAFSWAQAAELNPGNLVGRYKVEAKAGFQKVYVNFRVLSTKEFEIQRTYPDGHSDETCNGTYGMSSNIFWDFQTFGVGKVFNGTFTCPSNRSKEIQFSIDFQDKTTDDLIAGTSVTVTSSMARGIRLNAYVKKQ